MAKNVGEQQHEQRNNKHYYRINQIVCTVLFFIHYSH